MKKRLLFILAIALISASCNRFDLSQEEAKGLVTQSLHLPCIFRLDVHKMPSLNEGFALLGLYRAGLVTNSDYENHGPVYTQPTDLGRSSYLGETADAYMFKTNDIDFVQITGVSLNKDQQTATIRFTLKAANVTLAGYALAKTMGNLNGDHSIVYSLTRPLNGELTYKKFDNGWQLATDENKSSLDLLNQILDTEENSNRQDEYATEVNNLTSEIQAKLPAGGDTNAPTQFASDNNNSPNNNSTTYGIYPQSSTRLLAGSELSALSKHDLKIMRNEIFARHGYIFKTPDMQQYFSAQSWYKPLNNDVNNQLSSIEKTNVELIKNYEQ